MLPEARDQADLNALLPTGPPVSAGEAMGGLDLAAAAPPERPYVVVNMVATADGRATLEGRTGGMGGPADRALFHELRTQADGVLFGAGTARIERYGRMARGAEDLAKRRAEGVREEPLACVMSGAMTLGPDLPLFRDPASEVLVVTASDEGVPRPSARVSYLRPEGDSDYLRPSRRGALALAPVLRRLREEHGIRSLLCEGGPHLNRALLREGLVDELFLTLSPKLTADPGAPSIVSGPALSEPVGMALVRLLEHGGYLFLRYRIGG